MSESARADRSGVLPETEQLVLPVPLRNVDIGLPAPENCAAESARYQGATKKHTHGAFQRFLVMIVLVGSRSSSSWSLTIVPPAVSPKFLEI